jgi:SAM-dependent methyltransferase
MSSQIDADAFNEFEAAGWHDRATGYHRAFVPLTSRLIEPLLDAAEVAAGTRVLDVGSGPGYVAAACAARDASPIGVDVAPQMVTLARSLHPHIEFVEGSAEQLPFEDASFDAVVANFAILHVGRPERAAAEMRRVLKPGGSVALSTWDAPGNARLPGIFFDAVQEVGAVAPSDVPTGPPMFRFADDDAFTRLLCEAGLDQVKVQTVAFVYHFVGDLYDFLLEGTVRARALVVGQPEATRSRIRDTIDRLSHPYAAGAGLDLPISVKVASGAVARSPRSGER